MATDSSWIGSLDVDTFVKTQMMREQAGIDKSRQPFLDQLNQKQSGLKIQSSVYTQLQQLVNTFQQKLTQLQTAFNPTYQVGYSTSGIVNAQITGAVSPGSHTLHVEQLAKAGSLQSQNISSTNTALGYSQALTIKLGPDGSPTQQFNVNIGAGDSLQTIVSSINNTAQANNAGVTASIVSTVSGQYQLVVSSNQTGLNNNVNITGTGTGLTMTALTTAQNAEFTYDNLNFEQASNSNIIQGVNVTLLNEGDTNIILTPSSQINNVTTTLQDVVTSYNQIMSLISQAQVQLSAPDPNLNLIKSTLQDEMKLSSLTQYGIVPNTTPQTVQVTMANGKDVTTAYLTGLIQVDSTMLSSALTNHYSNVQAALFNTQNGAFAGVLNDGLNAGTGLVWKALNDAKAGGIAVVNTALNQVTQDIQDETIATQERKDSLSLKYAQLQVTLTNMQNISNYMFQQIQMMGGK